MKTSKKLCPRWNEFNAVRPPSPSPSLHSRSLLSPLLLCVSQPKESATAGSALPSFGGGLALPSMGAVPVVSPTAPAKTLKFKLGGAMSPPAGADGDYVPAPE